jgi:FkbM family methyltransferase
MLTMIQSLAFALYEKIEKLRFFENDLFDSLFVKFYNFYKKFEAIPPDRLKEFIPEGCTVIDAGGGMGFYSRAFSDFVSPKGQVICFEPEDRNYRRIKKIRFPNQNIVIERIACSDFTGKIGFRVDAKNPANHSIDSISEVLVDCLRIDEYSMFENRVAFIKIDVQGHELEVLLGASKILVQDFPAVLVEFDNRESNKKSIQILSFMKKMKYFPSILVDGTFKVVEKTDDVLMLRSYFDVLFLPK